MPSSNKAGCNCCSAQCGTITFTVRGCPSPSSGTTLRIQGATITVYDGANNTFPVLTTGTTDSSGQLVVPISAAKTYAYTIAAARFNTQSSTVGAACTGSSNTSVLSNLTIANAALQVCTPGCSLPLARTLHMSTPAGIVTLTYGGTDLYWTGSATFGCGTVTFNIASGNGTGTVFHVVNGFPSFSSGLTNNQTPATTTCPTVASPGSLAVTYTSAAGFGTCWGAGTTLTLSE